MNKYPASRFTVRQPAPDYRPESRRGTLVLVLCGVALIILGALAEGILPT